MAFSGKVNNDRDAVLIKNVLAFHNPGYRRAKKVGLAAELFIDAERFRRLPHRSACRS
jgi:hypothetical protein